MQIIEDTCPLCGERYYYSQLIGCYICGRFFCRNCIIYEHERVLCLNCARRMYSPKGPKSKYVKLSIFLARKAKYKRTLKLSMKQIEEIIGDKLPFSAYHSKYWWTSRSRGQSEAWLATGWIIQDVDLEHGEVTFKLTHNLNNKENANPKRRKTRRERKKIKSKRRRRREPSKTKISIIQARLKNIERQRGIHEYRGLRKKKSIYERRLYREGSTGLNG